MLKDSDLSIGRCLNVDKADGQFKLVVKLKKIETYEDPWGINKTWTLNNC